jgi:hypothetical protein
LRGKVLGMVRSWMSIAVGILAAAGIATAAPDPFDRLEKELPPGWTVLATGSELVFRHDRPCYVTGRRHDNAPADESQRSAPPAPPGGGPLVTIELRYRLEPRWTEPQIAAARATNDKVAGELRALAARYRIDAIHHSKGRPLPTTPDERARLDAYEAEHARLTARLVKLPRCSLGDASVFDGDDTYAQLSLEVDPPDVMAQAHRIIELMKSRCG